MNLLELYDRIKQELKESSTLAGTIDSAPSNPKIMIEVFHNS